MAKVYDQYGNLVEEAPGVGLLPPPPLPPGGLVPQIGIPGPRPAGAPPMGAGGLPAIGQGQGMPPAQDASGGFLGSPMGSDPTGRFLSSPGFAMANQGVTNLGRMMRGLEPEEDPLAAYQRQVMQNANMRLSDERNRREQKILERNDPYYEFTEGKRRGILPPEMTWEQFQQAKYRVTGDTANIRDLKMIMELRQPQREGESKEQYDSRLAYATTLENLAINPIAYNWGASGAGITSGARPGQSPVYGGGAPVGPGGPAPAPGGAAPMPGGTSGGAPMGGGGGADLTVTPAEAARNAAASAGQSQTAKNWATINSTYAQAAPGAYQDLTQLIDLTDEIMKTLDDPSLDKHSGFFQGRIGEFTNAAAAKLKTLSMLAAIPEVRDAKLTPVSNTDLSAIQATFGNLLADPEANKEAVRAHLNLLRKRAEAMNKTLQYFQSHGNDLSGYVNTLPQIDTSGGDTGGDGGGGPRKIKLDLD